MFSDVNDLYRILSHAPLLASALDATGKDAGSRGYSIFDIYDIYATVLLQHHDEAAVISALAGHKPSDFRAALDEVVAGPPSADIVKVLPNSARYLLSIDLDASMLAEPLRPFHIIAGLLARPRQVIHAVYEYVWKLDPRRVLNAVLSSYDPQTPAHADPSSYSRSSPAVPAYYLGLYDLFLALNAVTQARAVRLTEEQTRALLSKLPPGPDRSKEEGL